MEIDIQSKAFFVYFTKNCKETCKLICTLRKVTQRIHHKTEEVWSIEYGVHEAIFKYSNGKVIIGESPNHLPIPNMVTNWMSHKLLLAQTKVVMKFLAKTLITTNLVNRLAYKAGHSVGSGKYKHTTNYRQSRWHSTEGLREEKKKKCDKLNVDHNMYLQKRK